MQNLVKDFQFSMGTSDIKKSYRFFKNLGFKKIAEGSFPKRFIKMYDGSVIISIVDEIESYLKIALFRENIEEIMKNSEEAGIIIGNLFKKDNGDIFSADFTLAEGIEFRVINRKFDDIIDFRTSLFDEVLMLDSSDADMYPNDKLGVFSEIVCPVSDNEEKLVKQFEVFGFKPKGVNNIPYKQLTLNDRKLEVRLHFTDDFDKTGLCYIAPDMGAKVDELKRDRFKVNDIECQCGSNYIETPSGNIIFLMPL